MQDFTIVGWYKGAAFMTADAMQAMKETGRDVGNGWEPLISPKQVQSAIYDAYERASSLCRMTTPQLLLLAGDMTPQELRTTHAILNNRAETIRSLKWRGPEMEPPKKLPPAAYQTQTFSDTN